MHFHLRLHQPFRLWSVVFLSFFTQPALQFFLPSTFLRYLTVLGVPYMHSHHMCLPPVWHYSLVGSQRPSPPVFRNLPHPWLLRVSLFHGNVIRTSPLQPYACILLGFYFTFKILDAFVTLYLWHSWPPKNLKTFFEPFSRDFLSPQFFVRF